MSTYVRATIVYQNQKDQMKNNGEFGNILVAHFHCTDNSLGKTCDSKKTTGFCGPTA